MKKNLKNTEKRAYISPIVERILLDNEISLAMESEDTSPPVEPLLNAKAPEYLNITHLGLI